MERDRLRVRLKEWRLKAALTQDQLAERVGSTKANISRIERGLQFPQPPMIRRLADALGIDPADLIARVDD